LVHSPLPQEGKLIWKEKTGEDWPHRGWWSKPESLDMEIFDIPLNKKIYRRYKKAISDPDNYVILATGRIAPLKDEVYTILEHYGLSFDETHLNPGIDTFEFKSNLFAKLIYELQPEEFIMYDDRQEHLVRFVGWANAMPCKVTIVDAISGEEFKPQNNPLQESIRRILKEETEPKIELTNLEKKGIDLVFKILKNNYPFVYGWETIEKGMFELDLLLICDVKKLCEFYNSELKDYFKRNPQEMYKKDFPYPFSVLNLSNDIDSDEKWALYKDLNEHMNEIYEFIPDELKMRDKFDDVIKLDAELFTFK